MKRHDINSRAHALCNGMAVAGDLRYEQFKTDLWRLWSTGRYTKAALFDLDAHAVKEAIRRMDHPWENEQ